MSCVLLLVVMVMGVSVLADDGAHMEPLLHRLGKKWDDYQPPLLHTFGKKWGDYQRPLLHSFGKKWGSPDMLLHQLQGGAFGKRSMDKRAMEIPDDVIGDGAPQHRVFYPLYRFGKRMTSLDGLSKRPINRQFYTPWFGKRSLQPGRFQFPAFGKRGTSHGDFDPERFYYHMGKRAQEDIDSEPIRDKDPSDWSDRKTRDSGEDCSRMRARKPGLLCVVHGLLRPQVDTRSSPVTSPHFRISGDVICNRPISVRDMRKGGQPISVKPRRKRGQYANHLPVMYMLRRVQRLLHPPPDVNDMTSQWSIYRRNYYNHPPIANDLGR